MTQTSSAAAEALVPADVDWRYYESKVVTSLAERDPGEAWVAVFDCQFQLFQALNREADMARCHLLALTCEAEHRVHVCDGEPEPPVATLADIERDAAGGDHSALRGHAFGLWLHVWRCAVRRDDYDTLARLACMWLAHARHYPPAQFVPATPPMF